MKNEITLKGKIVFDPADMTKKHGAQSSWKKTAMIFFSGDICEYYSWYIWKKYNLDLKRPLRGPHLSFINDKGSAMNGKWEEVKKKWDGKMIDVVFVVDMRAQDEHWWINVPQHERGQIHDIRKELGLDRPFFGLHMTVGIAVNCKPDVEYHDNVGGAIRMNLEHSQYIIESIKKGITN